MNPLVNESAPNPVIVTAAWVAPISRPLIRDGAVFFCNGKIAAVGSVNSLKDQMTDATVFDAGNAVILPGLINAHTHLELSSIKRGHKPGRFVDWIIDLMNTPVPPGGVQSGIAQCLKFGVTAVGDITSQPSITRPVLTDSPLRGVSYGEVRAMARRRHFLEPRLLAAVEPGGAVRVGITPHAPYSIESQGYARCLQAAKDGAFPLATHLSETLDESVFLSDHSGPFKELWDLLAAWDEHVPRYVGGPIRFARSLGLLDFPTLLAHVNYCDDQELSLLSKGNASVVYCPRTHAFFGHPSHRWREMLLRGINVAIGTDSCASSPDLNLVEDLRLLHNLAPDVDPLLLWRLATTHAAKAIQRNDLGSLEPGQFADAVVFDVAGEDPLREILETTALPASVWIGGIQR